MREFNTDARDYSYTWSKDPAAEAAYLADKAHIEAQAGRPLTNWEIDEIKRRHEDP